MNTDFGGFTKWLGTFNRALAIDGQDRGTVPDLIARRDGRTYLIEVKSGVAKLTKNQRTALNQSREFGMIPCVMRVDLRFAVQEASLNEV